MVQAEKKGNKEDDREEQQRRDGPGAFGKVGKLCYFGSICLGEDN